MSKLILPGSIDYGIPNRNDGFIIGKQESMEPKLSLKSNIAALRTIVNDINPSLADNQSQSSGIIIPEGFDIAAQYSTKKNLKDQKQPKQEELKLASIVLPLIDATIELDQALGKKSQIDTIEGINTSSQYIDIQISYNKLRRILVNNQGLMNNPVFRNLQSRLLEIEKFYNIGPDSGTDDPFLNTINSVIPISFKYDDSNLHEIAVRLKNLETEPNSLEAKITQYYSFVFEELSRLEDKKASKRVGKKDRSRHVMHTSFDKAYNMTDIMKGGDEEKKLEKMVETLKYLSNRLKLSDLDYASQLSSLIQTFESSKYISESQEIPYSEEVIKSEFIKSELLNQLTTSNGLVIELVTATLRHVELNEEELTLVLNKLTSSQARISQIPRFGLAYHIRTLQEKYPQSPLLTKYFNSRMKLSSELGQLSKPQLAEIIFTKEVDPKLVEQDTSGLIPEDQKQLLTKLSNLAQLAWEDVLPYPSTDQSKVGIEIETPLPVITETKSKIHSAFDSYGIKDTQRVRINGPVIDGFNSSFERFLKSQVGHEEVRRDGHKLSFDESYKRTLEQLASYNRNCRSAPVDSWDSEEILHSVHITLDSASHPHPIRIWEGEQGRRHKKAWESRGHGTSSMTSPHALESTMQMMARLGQVEAKNSVSLPDSYLPNSNQNDMRDYVFGYLIQNYPPEFRSEIFTLFINCESSVNKLLTSYPDLITLFSNYDESIDLVADQLPWSSLFVKQSRLLETKNPGNDQEFKFKERTNFVLQSGELKFKGPLNNWPQSVLHKKDKIYLKFEGGYKVYDQDLELDPDFDGIEVVEVSEWFLVTKLPSGDLKVKFFASGYNEDSDDKLLLASDGLIKAEVSYNELDNSEFLHVEYKDGIVIIDRYGTSLLLDKVDSVEFEEEVFMYKVQRGEGVNYLNSNNMSGLLFDGPTFPNSIDILESSTTKYYKATYDNGCNILRGKNTLLFSETMKAIQVDEYRNIYLGQAFDGSMRLVFKGSDEQVIEQLSTDAIIVGGSRHIDRTHSGVLLQDGEFKSFNILENQSYDVPSFVKNIRFKSNPDEQLQTIDKEFSLLTIDGQSIRIVDHNTGEIYPKEGVYNTYDVRYKLSYPSSDQKLYYLHNGDIIDLNNDGVIVACDVAQAYNLDDDEESNKFVIEDNSGKINIINADGKLELTGELPNKIRRLENNLSVLVYDDRQDIYHTVHGLLSTKIDLTGFKDIRGNNLIFEDGSINTLNINGGLLFGNNVSPDTKILTFEYFVVLKSKEGDFQFFNKSGEALFELPSGVNFETLYDQQIGKNNYIVFDVSLYNESGDSDSYCNVYDPIKGKFMFDKDNYQAWPYDIKDLNNSQLLSYESFNEDGERVTGLADYENWEYIGIYNKLENTRFEDLILASSSSGSQILNQEGKPILPEEYEQRPLNYYREENLLKLIIGKGSTTRYNFINSNQELVLDNSIDQLPNFVSKLGPNFLLELIGDESRYNLMTEEGELLFENDIPQLPDLIGKFGDDYYFCTMNSGFKILNFEGVDLLGSIEGIKNVILLPGGNSCIIEYEDGHHNVLDSQGELMFDDSTNLPKSITLQNNKRDTFEIQVTFANDESKLFTLVKD
jgi:hypothetical protein